MVKKEPWPSWNADNKNKSTHFLNLLEVYIMFYPRRSNPRYPHHPRLYFGFDCSFAALGSLLSTVNCQLFLYTGSAKPISAPFPGSLSAQTRPPRASMICLTIASPRPVPPLRDSELYRPYKTFPRPTAVLPPGSPHPHLLRKLRQSLYFQ